MIEKIDKFNVYLAFDGSFSSHIVCFACDKNSYTYNPTYIDNTFLNLAEGVLAMSQGGYYYESYLVDEPGEVFFSFHKNGENIRMVFVSDCEDGNETGEVKLDFFVEVNKNLFLNSFLKSLKELEKSFDSQDYAQYEQSVGHKFPYEQIKQIESNIDIL